VPKDPLVSAGELDTVLCCVSMPYERQPTRPQRTEPRAAVAAAREPRRYAGLILSGAALSPLDWVLVLADYDDAELALDPAELSSDPFYLDELAYDPLAFTSTAGARTLAAVLPPAWDELAGAFGQVTLPVLFVHGSEDRVVPAAHARAWSGRLAGARLAEFAWARHDILNETVHREVAAAITEFVLNAGAGSAGVRPTASSHPLPAAQPAR
jgi:pimeloyl-ACP methyl ester carboxylesterase